MKIDASSASGEGSAQGGVTRLEQVALTADQQAASHFFKILPAEIRNQIYAEIWSSADGGTLKQHIVPSSWAEKKFACTPCITNPNRPDTRLEPVHDNEEKELHQRRMGSPWALHWPCEEHAHDLEFGNDNREKLPFLPVILGCKRLYVEGLTSILSTITFVFTDTTLAASFLGNYANAASLTSVELSIRITPLLSELYYPRSEGPAPRRRGQQLVTAAANPWESLCRALAGLPRLRRLHVWMDSEDLREWHKRVAETRLFATLGRDVKVLGGGAFTLALPDLPESASKRGLDDRYYLLTGAEDPEDGRRPFAVVRGERLNNWHAHLSAQVTRLMIEAGPSWDG